MRLRHYLVISACLLGLCTVARSAQAQTYSIMHSFQCSPDGQFPQGNLVGDDAGNIYGTTENGGTFGAGAVYKMSPDGTVTVLYSFTGGSDGAGPVSGVVRDSAGNLYGTAKNGGGEDVCIEGFESGCGTVFEVAPDGTFTLLHSFQGPPNDGAFPQAGLTMGPGGNLYGIAGGGSNDAGIIFEISPDGSRFRTVLDFAGSPTGGSISPLIRDQAGSLYGEGAESVFELDPASKTLTDLHDFIGGAGDGRFPLGGLARDTQGNLYGVTEQGGNGNGNPVCNDEGCGVVFKLDPSGNETILYNFIGKRDGGVPYAGVTVDSKGNVFGTAAFGGTTECRSSGCGVVFEISPAGKQRALHAFAGPPNDGMVPGSTPLYYGGSIYGTTENGGDSGNSCGTIFKYTP